MSPPANESPAPCASTHGPGQRRRRPLALSAGRGLDRAAARAARADHGARRRVDLAVDEALAGVAGAHHERVDLHARPREGRARAHGGHDLAGRTGPAEGAGVAAGEVDGVGSGEPGPGERVRAQRHEPVADHGDRALPGVVEEDERAALRLRAPCDRELDAHRLELARRPAAKLVVAESGEEQTAAGELDDLDRGHGRAAGRLLPGAVRLDDLAGAGQALDGRELGVFDVADDGDRHRVHTRGLCIALRLRPGAARGGLASVRPLSDDPRACILQSRARPLTGAEIGERTPDADRRRLSVPRRPLDNHRLLRLAGVDLDRDHVLHRHLPPPRHRRRA